LTSVFAASAAAASSIATALSNASCAWRDVTVTMETLDVIPPSKAPLLDLLQNFHNKTTPNTVICAYIRCTASADNGDTTRETHGAVAVSVLFLSSDVTHLRQCT